MIDVFLKTKELKRFENLTEIGQKISDFYLMQLIDISPEEIQLLENQYFIDASILKRYEDIEISSHFLASEKQVAFHISLPFYNAEKDLEERQLFFIFTNDRFFLFLNSDIDAYINKNYLSKMMQLPKIQSVSDIFDLQVEFISDYFADITESEMKKIKQLAASVLQKQKFSNNTLNLIAKYSFNNLLIKEMLIETTRILLLYKKFLASQQPDIQRVIDRELSDLSVVSDYIQFNSERLLTMKETVARKLDVEQNYIFKVLTIITLCVSLPTMIAGIYGMNFEYMPELSQPYAYPIVLGVMVLSAFIPLVFVKIKKWL